MPTDVRRERNLRSKSGREAPAREPPSSIFMGSFASRFGKFRFP
jgi:hypothetical protein